ncbi:MAG: metallophosphoesterase [Candidatus Hydrogenedentes bacterium]|nr:metallophosphoesterase [Candidatus Hydrogenedentota bacterium]
MGDAQVGFEKWGDLLHLAVERHPDAAFCTLAGDLSNRGCDRNDWDAFLHGAEGVFNHVPFVPALGNHDNCDEGAMYRALFDLPKNGPSGVVPELAYAFEYENALFLVLNSNWRPSTQTAWIERQLSQSKASWKFAIFHHPPYSPKANRDNPEIRDEWCPVFDKYHVDMVLTGHDHSYMRTYPFKKGVRTETAADGTVYVVSVSGTKFYEQQPGKGSAVAFAKVPTYQVIDIDAKRLTYRAYDPNEKAMDELVIEK